MFALLLIALWLPVRLLIAARQQEIDVAHAFLAGAVLFVLALLLTAALTRLFRFRSSLRLANLIAVLLFSVFMFGDLAAAVAGFGVDSAVAHLALWGSLTLLAAILTWTLLRGRRGQLLLTVAGALLLTGGTTYLAAGRLYLPLRTTVLADGGAEAMRRNPPPNLYLFAADGYGDQAAMRERAGSDAAVFYRALRQRGFFVAKTSRLAFPTTRETAASLLSLDYLGTKRPPVLSRQRGATALTSALKAKGYRIAIAIPPGGSGSGAPRGHCPPIADACLFSQDGASGPLGSLPGRLAGMTPVAAIGSILGRSKASRAPGGTIDPLAVVHSAKARLRRPAFLLAEIGAPGARPFYDDDCRALPSPQVPAAGWSDDRRRSFGHDVACFNARLLAAVDTILQGDPSALIVLTALSGPGFLSAAAGPPDAWSDAALAERMSVLSAFRSPLRCREQAGPAISPVNTMRLVLACLRGRPALLLPDLPARVAVQG